MATQTVSQAPASGGVSASGLRQETLAKATETMFGKIAEYVRGEVHASTEEYTLLERLNKLATADFLDLTNKTKDAGASIQQIQDKAKEIQPCLDEIDVLEASTSELLNTAQLLDDYSKRVESKYKELMMARRS